MNATPQELCDRARKLGLRLEPKGDKLAVSPADRVPPDFAAVLRDNKPALLEWLSNPPCPGLQTVPPCDLPLDPVMPRPSPANRERVIRYLLLQTGNRPGPLSAWLVRRETAYFDQPGRHWDCSFLAYAAARDAARWQFNRSESEVWELLTDFQSLNVSES